jgi:tRNA threonylcarbamoyladenosine biosynthesis protein TsaE
MGGGLATNVLERRSHSEADTEALGEALGLALEPGDVVSLEGPLGAGKTRFVAGVARGAGSRSRVRSPSFAIVHEYSGRVRIAHLDLYRLESAECDALGLEELRERAALLVEWGEKLPAAWSAEALRVSIAPEGGDRRALRAEANESRALALLSAWRDRLDAPAPAPKPAEGAS